MDVFPVARSMTTLERDARLESSDQERREGATVPVFWAGIGVALIVALFLRDTIDLTVRHERNPVFVTLSDGSIRNTYEVRLRNKQAEERPFHISLTSDHDLFADLEGA